MRKLFASATVTMAGIFALAVLALTAAWGDEPASPGKVHPQRHPSTAGAKRDSHAVSVFVYDDHGKLVGPVSSPKLTLSAAQWRKRLTQEQFQVLRGKGTEAAFCGDLVDNKKDGVYSCAGCGLPLFASTAKFDSGTGWPSFIRPVADQNIETAPDTRDGTLRVETKCVRCKGHLGHVFDDGPAPTGLRYCLNSASLVFTEKSDLAKLADPATKHAHAGTTLASAEAVADNDTSGATDAQPPRGKSDRATTPRARAKDKQDSKETGMSEQAVFAGGCFWCTEAAFQQLRGVSDVESGYAGGKANTATYEQVSMGNTGHAEAIRVTYDPAVISYDQLLMVFFDAHDPTQLNRQGNDVGTQYRSAIFYANDEEKKAAETKMHDLAHDKAHGSKRIVTKLEPLTAFHPAENYHQDFVLHNPLQPYVRGHSIPKACAVQKRHPELIDPDKAIKPVGQ